MKQKLHFESNHPIAQYKAFEAIKKEQGVVGYYDLPEQDITPIMAYCEEISEEIETVVVVGIGGSSLGAKAVYEFLKPTTKLKRKLYFIETTDPIALRMIFKEIEIEKTHFIVTSKSGTTIETFAAYKYILTLQPNASAYTFITDPDSPLEKYAREIGAYLLNLPSNVGGRFSVLSVVGLAPLALCGIDIKTLLAGAKHVKVSFFDQGYLQEPMLKKAVYYAKNHWQYDINCIFAYSESLKYFTEWYVQLWGESLGKHQRHSSFHLGLTPIGLIGPKDQHSFLQLLADGTRNKTITFIKIDDFEDDMMIPDISLPHLESLDTINNLSFATLINMQCDSVIESLLAEKNIPVDIITLPKADVHSIGSLIFYFELITSLVAELMDVNAYDQPGVESGKKILKNKLNAR